MQIKPANASVKHKSLTKVNADKGSSLRCASQVGIEYILLRRPQVHRGVIAGKKRLQDILCDKKQQQIL